MTRERMALWLKIAVLLAVAILFGGMFVLLPLIGSEMAQMYPEIAFLFWPTLIWCWALGAVIVAALCFFWGICDRIQKDNSFCEANAKALGRIAQLALVDVVLGFGLLIFLSCTAHPHPSLFLLFFLLLFCGLAVEVASALLAHLVQKAARIQQENDLTV